MKNPDPTVDAGGERLLLCAEHALSWPARHTLLIADAHFGKAASFRARGVPVPEATTNATLATLDDLLKRHRTERIVFLGDFLHSKEARAPQTLAALAHWRLRHPDLELVLVEGNHDAHAGAPPPGLGIRMVGEPFIDGPFALCHMPVPVAGRYVLAGHLHPAYRLAGRRDAVRLPCFWFGAKVGVLPAFGDFTGARAISPAAGDRVFVVAGDRVIAVPERRAA
jgi:DNA ligase-associated metallophosphoesterase